MQLRILAILILLSILFPPLNTAQSDKRDMGVMKEIKNPFWEKIETSVKTFKEGEKKEEKSFVMNFENYDLPNENSDFIKYWHNDPVPQANTNTCWAFSTTSFFESEIFRIINQKVKLSEMWTVYWEFVEKARGFVKSRGTWLFTDGSESNAVTRIWKKYGIVPAEVYTGLLPNQEYLSTGDMFDEMENYLKFVKANNIWNESEVITTIKSIMNHWIGTPPEKFDINGKTITPIEYLKEHLKINLDDYVEIMSLMQEPYYQFVEYKVPDNWWHNKDYYNIPLNDFMSTIKNGILNGYTICIGGDVSEAGKNSELDVFVVPSFDIPSEYIDENARQFRFSNNTTTDDHGIHLIGYTKKNDKYWFLVKDSGSSARNGKMNGYFIFSEDYVKLKMLSFTVHKDVLKEILKK
ncbi:MAG: peptidase C1 [Ignavibacteriae bacterium]|nr:peptidase C1 [Ignavibacteriota bacterium]